MFVDDRAGQVPVQDLARGGHGAGQGDAALLAQALEQDGHGEGPALGVGNFPIGEAGGEPCQLVIGRGLAIADFGNDAAGVHSTAGHMGGGKPAGQQVGNRHGQ